MERCYRMLKLAHTLYNLTTPWNRCSMNTHSQAFSFRTEFDTSFPFSSTTNVHCQQRYDAKSSNGNPRHCDHSMTQSAWMSLGSLVSLGPVGSVGASLMEPLPFNVPSGRLAGRPLSTPGASQPSGWSQQSKASSHGLRILAPWWSFVLCWYVDVFWYVLVDIGMCAGDMLECDLQVKHLRIILELETPFNGCKEYAGHWTDS